MRFLLLYGMLLYARVSWPLQRRRGESALRAWASIILTYWCFFLAKWLSNMVA